MDSANRDGAGAMDMNGLLGKSVRLGSDKNQNPPGGRWWASRGQLTFNKREFRRWTLDCSEGIAERGAAAPGYGAPQARDEREAEGDGGDHPAFG